MTRAPKRIGTILSELMARHGYAQVRNAAALDDAWQQAAGELAAQYSRAGTVRRGVLEVMVANSTLVQELVFQKPGLLDSLKALVPDQTIRDLKFRVGRID